MNTYPEALWWAVVTITTVGYGDYSPVTIEGRLVALTMMIGGMVSSVSSPAPWPAGSSDASRPTSRPTGRP
nr:potassium channel family protein [Actinoplanes aksuensis]